MPVSVLSRLSPRLVRPILLSVLLTLVVKTAWVGDDAFITLRTVDNLVHGHGLVWNLGERIQVFTHPLWMMLLTVFYAVIREPFITFYVISAVFSLAACALLLWRLAGSTTNAVLAGLALAFSKYFIDYATGGLDNPLLFLLAAWFVLLWFRLADELDAGRPAEGAVQRQVFLLVLATALLLLTRLDTILLFGPPLATALRRAGRRYWRPVLLGLVPLAAWEIFAVVYFGFPVPNTAYAKLNTGIAMGALAQQSLYYYLDLLRSDPLLALVMIAGLVTIFARPMRGERAFGVGVVLVLLYIIRIGGDFMGGRFFTLPFFLVVCLLVRRPAPRPKPAGGIAVVLAAALFVPDNPVTCARAYDVPPYFHGIADERGYYYQGTGALWRLKPDREPFVFEKWGRDSRLRTDAQGPAYAALECVGMPGYFGGPDLYVVDLMALGNAFLARYPANLTTFRGGWRIGHFSRDLPEGYIETISDDRNQLVKPQDSELYEQIQLVTTGPLFTRARWRAIWDLNLRPFTGR